MSTQENIRQEITDQIVAALEAGGLPPWRRPWSGGGLPKNALSDHRYSGINVLLLQHAGLQSGFESPLWATYKQWQAMGEQVAKGQRGTRIVFYKPVTKLVTDHASGEEREELFPILRTYSVFNLDQVEGESVERLRAKHLHTVRAEFLDFQPAETTILATGAAFRYHSGRAYYDSANDLIALPKKDQFDTPGDYYGTAFHELAHWTGHESRLKRPGGSFGDAKYAEEELVAELSAAYLLAETGVPQSDDLSNHNAYVASWLRALKNDTRFIFRAATAASKATDFVLSFSRQASMVAA